MTDLINLKPSPQDIKLIEKAAKTALRWEAGHKASWEDSSEKNKTFMAFFGCNSIVVAALWNEIQELIDDDVYRMHLLWTLVWLKIYATELVLCSLVGWPTPKTFREKVFILLNVLQI